MKVKLLCNGGHGGMENVKFPVVVEGDYFSTLGCDVLGSELIRVGGNDECFCQDHGYGFIYGKECEVIEE